MSRDRGPTRTTAARPERPRTWGGPRALFLVGQNRGLGGRVAAWNSPALAGDSSPGAASGQPPHMSISHSIYRTTSFPVYGRPYSCAWRGTTDFGLSAITDDRRVDQCCEVGGDRSRWQRSAVESVHAGGERDGRDQPNPLSSNEIRWSQCSVVAVVALVAGHVEQRLLGGASQDRVPRGRRQQAGASVVAIGGDHHRGARALQDVALGAEEYHVVGALARGMP